MHIAVFSPVYPPYRGGMGAVAQQEVRLLQEAGHSVQVFTPAYTKKHPSHEEDVFRVHPWFSWGNAAALPWRYMWRAVAQADVVHVHYPFFGTAVFAVCFAKLSKKRVVVSWHMRARAERGALVRRAIFFLHRICEEPLIRRMADVVCVSSAAYAEMLNIPKEKTCIVPFGIDTRRFFPERNTVLREEYGLSDATCVFLFVGGMDRAHAFKGVPLLLHAFAQLPPSLDVRVWLVGDGELHALYTQLADELGIAQRVHFFGSVTPEALPGVYQASDVHILPSVSSAETYGLVTCEAGACGIPSIVSALPGVKNLVIHERTGLHVAPKNMTELSQAMSRVALHAKERAAWGHSAYENIAKNYTLAREQEMLLRAITGKGIVHE